MIRLICPECESDNIAVLQVKHLLKCLECKKEHHIVEFNLERMHVMIMQWRKTND